MSENTNANPEPVELPTVTVTLVGHTYRDCTVEVTAYGQPVLPAMILNGVDEEFGYPEPVTTVSVNLVQYGYLPDDDCIFVKDYDENEGLFDQLVAQQVLEATGRTVTGGYNDQCTWREGRLLGSYREAWHAVQGKVSKFGATR